MTERLVIIVGLIVSILTNEKAGKMPNDQSKVWKLTVQVGHIFNSQNMMFFSLKRA